MRIIAGRWAGKSLVSPAGRVRPTAEPVRDALLTRLAGSLPEATIVDLFAGSGALGLEALSRGAARCDFVESGAAALHALKANVAALHVRDRTRIFKRDVLDFAEGIVQPYDIAFADPPYRSWQLDRLIGIWTSRPFSAVLAIEHAANHPLGIAGAARRFGDTTITIVEARPHSLPERER